MSEIHRFDSYQVVDQLPVITVTATKRTKRFAAKSIVDIHVVAAGLLSLHIIACILILASMQQRPAPVPVRERILLSERKILITANYYNNEKVLPIHLHNVGFLHCSYNYWSGLAIASDRSDSRHWRRRVPIHLRERFQGLDTYDSWSISEHSSPKQRPSPSIVGRDSFMETLLWRR